MGCGITTAQHRVTADAVHCPKATGEAILANGGDNFPDRGGDVLAVKGNQQAPFEDIQLLLDDPEAAPDDRAQTVDGEHGRIETRRATVIQDVARLAERFGFSGPEAIGKVEARREIDGKATTACRYDVLSKPLSVEGFLEVVRTHWHVENRLHRVLDHNALPVWRGRGTRRWRQARPRGAQHAHVRAAGAEVAPPDVQSATGQIFVEKPTYFPPDDVASRERQERLEKEPAGRLATGREAAAFILFLAGLKSDFYCSRIFASFYCVINRHDGPAGGPIGGLDSGLELGPLIPGHLGGQVAHAMGEAALPGRAWEAGLAERGYRDPAARQGALMMPGAPSLTTRSGPPRPRERRPWRGKRPCSSTF